MPTPDSVLDALKGTMTASKIAERVGGAQRASDQDAVDMEALPTAHPIEPMPRKAELPPTYPAGRKCLRCGAELCIYHRADHGLCWPCEPGTEAEGGLVLEVEPGQWRRFQPVERERLRESFDLAELIAEAP